MSIRAGAARMQVTCGTEEGEIPNSALEKVLDQRSHDVIEHRWLRVVAPIRPSASVSEVSHQRIP